MRLSLLSIGMLLAMPMRAIAAVPDTPCTGLIGCGSSAANVAANSLPFIASHLLYIISGLAVVMIVWSGFNMMISFGDESKTSQFKWGVINSILGLALAVSSSTIVAFVGTEEFGQSGAPAMLIGNVLSSAVRIMLNLMNVTLLLIIIIGGIRLIAAQGKSEEQDKAKKMITWAIIGAVVINLANALVQAFAAFVGI